MNRNKFRNVLVFSGSSFNEYCTLYYLVNESYSQYLETIHSCRKVSEVLDRLLAQAMIKNTNCLLQISEIIMKVDKWEKENLV